MSKKVIRFTASWCGPCKMFAPTFDKVASQTPGVYFETVDVDSTNNLVLEYGIRNVPTTVVVETSGTIRKHSGIMTEQQLKQFIG
jgi:thioredoxin-like negative regulator of GroEL